jgi:3-methylfumaryl-CoA hydratase
MVFVTVQHRYASDGHALLVEEQDIVYRDAASDAEKQALRELGERARAGEHAFEREGQSMMAWQADPVMLFRYSASTFNGHRIHYDVDFAARSRAIPAWWCTARCWPR